MYENVELSSLDLRYEGHRLRDPAREARLLASIAERGIEEPLEGVDTPAARFLLNGFKRGRAAHKLGIACVPYASLGAEEAAGIFHLLRASTDKALGILEQARFLVDLLSIHGMGVAEVAETLSRSKGWISMRRGLLEEMGPAIEAVLFRGTFPVYSYMYTLRPFMRMNQVGREPVERFVAAVAGRRLSVRDIELLAQAYFRGPAPLREAIDGRQAGLVAAADEKRAPGPARLQRLRTRAARRPRGPAEVDAAGDGEVRRQASGKPGLLRPGQSLERRPAQYLRTVFGKDERVL